MKELTIEQFKQKIEEGSTVIDVRRLDEILQGKIDKSDLEVDFATSEFRENIQKFDKEKSYLLYCRSGGRSRNAMKVMKDLGFKDVSHLSGGKTAWDSMGNTIKQ